MARDRQTVLWIVLGIAGLLYLASRTQTGQNVIQQGITDLTTPRGIRNNNPGNIKYDGTQWQRLDNPPTDGTFCRFTNPIYGIRAIAVILGNYVSNDGIPSTVNSIIQRWSATDQDAYVENVAQAIGVDPNATINLDDYMDGIVAAIVTQENGQQPYDPSLIDQAVTSA